MTLTQFEWVLIASIGAILVAVVGHLAARFISMMREDMMREANARKAADLELAAALREIVGELNLHRVQDVEAHGNMVPRDELIEARTRSDMKIDALHKRLDEIRDMLAEFRGSYVTKEDCRERHAS